MKDLSNEISKKNEESSQALQEEPVIKLLLERVELLEDKLKKNFEMKDEKLFNVLKRLNDLDQKFTKKLADLNNPLENHNLMIRMTNLENFMKQSEKIHGQLQADIELLLERIHKFELMGRDYPDSKYRKEKIFKEMKQYSDMKMDHLKNEVEALHGHVSSLQKMMQEMYEKIAKKAKKESTLDFSVVKNEIEQMEEQLKEEIRNKLEIEARMNRKINSLTTVCSTMKEHFQTQIQMISSEFTIAMKELRDTILEKIELKDLNLLKMKKDQESLMQILQSKLEDVRSKEIALQAKMEKRDGKWEEVLKHELNLMKESLKRVLLRVDKETQFTGALHTSMLNDISTIKEEIEKLKVELQNHDIERLLENAIHKIEEHSERELIKKVITEIHTKIASEKEMDLIKFELNEKSTEIEKKIAEIIEKQNEKISTFAETVARFVNDIHLCMKDVEDIKIKNAEALNIINENYERKANVIDKKTEEMSLRIDESKKIRDSMFEYYSNIEYINSKIEDLIDLEIKVAVNGILEKIQFDEMNARFEENSKSLKELSEKIEKEIKALNNENQKTQEFISNDWIDSENRKLLNDMITKIEMDEMNEKILETENDLKKLSDKFGEMEPNITNRMNEFEKMSNSLNIKIENLKEEISLELTNTKEDLSIQKDVSLVLDEMISILEFQNVYSILEKRIEDVLKGIKNNQIETEKKLKTLLDDLNSKEYVLKNLLTNQINDMNNQKNIIGQLEPIKEELTKLQHSMTKDNEFHSNKISEIENKFKELESEMHKFKEGNEISSMIKNLQSEIENLQSIKQKNEETFVSLQNLHSSVKEELAQLRKRSNQFATIKDFDQLYEKMNAMEEQLSGILH